MRVTALAKVEFIYDPSKAEEAGNEAQIAETIQAILTHTMTGAAVSGLSVDVIASLS